MKTRIMTGIAAFGCVAFVLSAVLFSTADADVKAADDGKKAKQGKRWFGQAKILLSFCRESLTINIPIPRHSG